jgi:hypothetical protein
MPECMDAMPCGPRSMSTPAKNGPLRMHLYNVNEMW